MHLITRPDSEAHLFAAACAERGIATHLAPLFRITSTPLPDAALQAAATADAIVLTSRNALPALAAFHHKRLVCVGTATTALAQAAGFTRALCGGETASALATTLTTQRHAWPRLFYARGAQIAFPLTPRLQAAGLQVSEAIAYQTTPCTALPPETAALLTAGSITSASLFSAETARLFADLVGNYSLPGPLPVFCLSPATAQPLAGHPLFSIHTAPAPSAVALLNLIDRTVNCR
jgi:uroporphyrinogen-III synthase